jgi:hypothetical protein
VFRLSINAPRLVLPLAAVRFAAWLLALGAVDGASESEYTDAADEGEWDPPQE